MNEATVRQAPEEGVAGMEQALASDLQAIRQPGDQPTNLQNFGLADRRVRTLRLSRR